MILTISVLLLIGAVLILFSDDIAHYGKKLFKIPGMTTLLPLLVASWLVVKIEYWLWLAAMYGYYGMVYFVQLTTPWIPYAWLAGWLPISVLITIISVVPVGLYEKFHRPHSNEPKHKADYISTLIWLSCLIIWLAAPDAEAYIPSQPQNANQQFLKSNHVPESVRPEERAKHASRRALFVAKNSHFEKTRVYSLEKYQDVPS